MSARHFPRQRRTRLRADFSRNVTKPKSEAVTAIAMETRTSVHLAMSIAKNAPSRVDVPQARSPFLPATVARSERLFIDEVVARHAACMREHEGERHENATRREIEELASDVLLKMPDAAQPRRPDGFKRRFRICNEHDVTRLARGKNQGRVLHCVAEASINRSKFARVNARDRRNGN